LHPGVYGLQPTDAVGVVAALFDDGVSTPTVGLYDTARRVPAGPTVAPDIVVEHGYLEGQVLMVAGFDDNGIWSLRTVDLAAGELRPPSFSLELEALSQIALDGDEFYAVYRGLNDGADENKIQRRALDDGSLLADSAEGYTSLAFGGGVLVAATIDGYINELDPVTLEVVGTRFPGTSGSVGNMSIDAAGRRLMIRATDDSLRFYDIPTRIRLGDPIDTDTPFANAALRSDGFAAAALTRRGIVAWDLDPAHWEGAACAVAGRDLTRDEWDQYIGDLAPYAPTCAGYD
jgi:hypothetical protein